MDTRYYQILRQSSQEDFYNAINDPEDELYDIIWDLFETTVIEAAEIFDVDFRDRNQFRYSIGSGMTLEFFPDAAYFERRIEPNPYSDDSDAAGIHLKLSISPHKSCLFSVGLQIWGASERQALKKLWRKHRKVLVDLFRRSKPMISTRTPYPSVQHTETVEEMLDNYFSLRDPENFIALSYSFAQADEAETAQNFMAVMAMLYHSVKDSCQNREDMLEYWLAQLKDFYSGHFPELPASLPCVEITIGSDAE
ncbi:MAG TPA: hypothetical protein VKZ59_01540 [Acidobacteriota bacterium]|nr:hypothetical protein [Acidobacteriota bacterium]